MKQIDYINKNLYKPNMKKMNSEKVDFVKDLRFGENKISPEKV